MPFFPPGTGAAMAGESDKLSEARVVAHSSDAASPSRIRIKNRRKRYIDIHPEYFSSANLELAGLRPTHYLNQLTHSTNTTSQIPSSTTA
jgi:hypothetical protein